MRPSRSSSTGKVQPSSPVYEELFKYTGLMGSYFASAKDYYGQPSKVHKIQRGRNLIPNSKASPNSHTNRNSFPIHFHTERNPLVIHKAILHSHSERNQMPIRKVSSHSHTDRNPVAVDEATQKEIHWQSMKPFIISTETPVAIHEANHYSRKEKIQFQSTKVIAINIQTEFLCNSWSQFLLPYSS